MVTNRRNIVQVTHDPQYNPSLQDKTDRMPSEVASSRGPTPVARDPRDDLGPQDETHQTVRTTIQSSTPQAHDLQYNLSLQQTMGHLDPMATTTHPGKAIAQPEVPMPQPHNVDLARTSSVSLSLPLGPNIRLPANRPKTFDDVQFLDTGGYYTEDSGQHIREGIAGEYFVSSHAVVLSWWP